MVLSGMFVMAYNAWKTVEGVRTVDAAIPEPA